MVAVMLLAMAGAVKVVSSSLLLLLTGVAAHLGSAICRNAHEPITSDVAAISLRNVLSFHFAEH